MESIPIDWVPFAAICLATAANLASNFLLLRFWRTMSVLQTIRIAAIVGLVVFFVVTLRVSILHPSGPDGDWWIRLGCAGVAYLILAYNVFGTVYVPVASVRLRLLGELVDKGPLSEATLLRNYGSAEILRLRLERLTASGQIVRKGDRYVTGKPRLLYAAKIFWLLKRLLLSGVVDHRSHLTKD